MVRSKRNRRLIRNKKGFSTVVATIFMVLAVLFLYFNVFMFIQNQNVQFQDVVSQAQQLDTDRNIEAGQVTIISPSVQHNGYFDSNSQTWIRTDELVFSFMITNNGQLPVNLTRFWATDFIQANSTSASPLSLVLRPGAQLSTVTIRVTLQGSAYESGIIRFWLVTSRGNQIGASAYL